MPPIARLNAGAVHHAAEARPRPRWSVPNQNSRAGRGEALRARSSGPGSGAAGRAPASAISDQPSTMTAPTTRQGFRRIQRPDARLDAIGRGAAHGSAAGPRPAAHVGPPPGLAGVGAGMRAQLGRSRGSRYV